MTDTNSHNTSGTPSRDEKAPPESEIIKTIATAENPLSTSQIATKLNIPRSSLWKILKRLETYNRVYSWKAHEKTRMWGINGQFGDTSINDIYGPCPVALYIETGAFKDDIEWRTIAEMVEEILVEINWKTPLNSGVKFHDMKMLAHLFNLSVNEFMEYSPHDIYSLIHDGRVYGIPKKSNYELPDGNMVDRHSPEEFRQKRTEETISQQAIAEHSGIPETTISAWEDGDKDLLNKESTKRLWNTLEAISYENT